MGRSRLGGREGTLVDDAVLHCKQWLRSCSQCVECSLTNLNRKHYSVQYSYKNLVNKNANAKIIIYTAFLTP